MSGDWSSTPKPRWPPGRWISPSTLKNYELCPQRVRFQLEDRIPPPTFVLFFSKGNAAHLALRRIAEALKRGETPIDDDAVLSMAHLFLPPESFPSDDERMWHANQVVDWVRYGRSYLTALRDPDWMIMERNLSREWRLFSGAPAFTVVAKPDLIVTRTDTDGDRIVDIIDYKTGKPRIETLQPVMLRFAARSLLADAGINPATTRVQFTYVWLDAGQRDVIDLSADYCNDHWTDIDASMKALASETDWPAQPSFLCHYCPFFGNHCPETIPPDDPLNRPEGAWE